MNVFNLPRFYEINLAFNAIIVAFILRYTYYNVYWLASKIKMRNQIIMVRTFIQFPVSVFAYSIYRGNFKDLQIGLYIRLPRYITYIKTHETLAIVNGQDSSVSRASDFCTDVSRDPEFESPWGLSKKLQNFFFKLRRHLAMCPHALNLHSV